MDPIGCPPQIEPGNAFRVVLKVPKYTAHVEYGGLVEMVEQEHELWLDRSIGYNLAQFYDYVATKIIWGPKQTLSVWVLDTNTGSKWKIRRDDQWQVMMKDKWDQRVAHIAVEIVDKDGYERNDSSMASKVSNTGIPPRSVVPNLDPSSAGSNADITGDTHTSPPQHVEETVPCLFPHSVTMQSTKKAKQTTPLSSSTANSTSDDDRISALDDDLCKLILRMAHLDMRELVCTSVLSKRWRGLWKRFPVLDFFGWPKLESAGDVRQYIAIVNNILEQRAGTTSEARIDEVKIPLLLDAYSLLGQREQLLWPVMEAAGSWIHYAMRHQVKGFQFGLRLPLLANKTPLMDLDELLPSSPKLECMRLGLSRTEVRLPRTAVFTSLKDLTLQFVELAVGSGHLLSRLSSSVCCPNLQKLSMMYINFKRAGTKELVLDAGELLELSMEFVNDMEFLELKTPKLLYFMINECEDLESLTVSAPGLKELKYYPKSGLIHGPFPCVWRLNIDLVTHTREDDNYGIDENSSTICLLKHCSSSLRCLFVHLYVPLVEDRHIDLIKNNIPQLPNVTSLSVSFDLECQHHSFGDGVASLLTRFKNLEFLGLELGGSPYIRSKMDEYDSVDEKAFSFTCNHSDNWESSNISLANLREADFRGMTGTGCELRFLQFVLASATHLQSVTVSFNLHFFLGATAPLDSSKQNLHFFEEEEEEEEEELQESRMHCFVHTLLRDGTWTVRENEDQDFDKLHNKCSKLYKWTPSP